MRSESGQSASAFVAVVAVALFLVAGLVVDGGGRLAAVARADAVAAAAVRLAADASAASGVDGGAGGAALGRRAAEEYLAAQPDVTGEVQVAGGVVSVEVRATRTTVFLSLVGIRTVAAEASASGVLRA
ncbi:hypothetical protein [Propionicicella superfundia]|uniref:hypothetical protein n=1 Tax=Propionicicella superfundia TaxID=348582 RepID=UPI0003F506D4|nr:hypothetical protein [Propionicicella superfundia]